MIMAAIVAVICFGVAITGFTSLDHITDSTQLADAKGFACFWAFLASLATAFGVLAWWIARTSKPGDDA